MNFEGEEAAAWRPQTATATRLGLWGQLLCAATLTIVWPAAAMADSMYFDIAAQPLATALKLFSSQSHMQLLYPYSAVASLRGNDVHGIWERHKALEEILRNSGLEVLYSSEDAAVIRPARPTQPGGAQEAAPSEAAGTSAVNDITISGEKKMTTNSLRARIFGFFAGCTVAVAGGIACAQNASAAGSSAGAGQNLAAPAKDAIEELAEVLVTANKREERLQSVPASIVAVTADVMEKQQILQIKDFAQFAPSLNFQGGDEARLFNFSIRGVGSESFSVGVEPSVSTIVDGVVYTRPGAAFDGLGDLERVEVLNGPQGTLQGKNASAGAVSIVTRRPNRKAFEARVEATVAQQNEQNVALTLSAPINDKWAYRFYGYEKSADGQVINVSNGKTVNDVNGYGFRGKLEFEPTDGVNLLLAGDYTYRDSPCCGEPVRVAAAAGNVTAAFSGAAVGPDSNQVNFNTEQEGTQKNGGMSLEANIDVRGLTLTSLTAYRKYEDYAIRDRDGTNAPFTGVTAQQLYSATNPGITQAAAVVLLQRLLLNPLSFSCRGDVCGESNNIEKNSTFTQELRLTSPGGGMFDYILGLYYYDSRVERDLTIGGVRSNIAGNVAFPTPGTVSVLRPTAYVLSDLVTKVDTVNKAVFGNFNYRPVSGLTLTAGFRYLQDTLHWNHRKVTGPNGDHIGGGANTNPAGQAAPGANIGTPAFNFVRDFSDSTTIGKLTAKYEFTPDVLTYVSWARGYKGIAVDADMFLSQAGADNSPVAPEKSRSWEAGLRSSFLNRRLTFNVTYYDTLFNGYQTASTGTDGSGAPVLRSAGQLFTKGWEVELAAHPIDGLTLAANAELGSYEFGNLFADATTNLKGGVPLDAPKQKYGFTAMYDFRIGTWGTSIAGNYSHVSETLFTNLNDATKVPNNVFSPWIRPAYGVANASFGLVSPSEKYRATLFVKNLLDEHYVSSLRRISGSVGGAGAVAQSIPRDFDRYFGITFTAKF